MTLAKLTAPALLAGTEPRDERALMVRLSADAELSSGAAPECAQAYLEQSAIP